jgi:hypothetical protein
VRISRLISTQIILVNNRKSQMKIPAYIEFIEQLEVLRNVYSQQSNEKLNHDVDHHDGS